MRTILIAAMAVLIASSYLSVPSEAQNLSKDKLERQDEIERLKLEVEGRDRELSRLNRQIAELSELLSLEQEAAVQLRELIVTPAEAGKNFLRGLLADDVRASETIGLSPSITCGKKIVTIPVIIDGEHMMSMTLWKSSITSLAFLNPKAMEKHRAMGRELVDYVLARISQTHLGGVSSGADEPGCGSICVVLRQSGPGLIV